METQRFSLDTGEHDGISLIARTIFGVVCIAAAIITTVKMAGSGLLNMNNIAAIVFLGLFGIWLLATGLGLTQRHMTLAGDSIVLKKSAYSPARTIKAADIREIEFSQLRITFTLKTGKIIALQLGLLYRESSLRLMEAVEQFCTSNGIVARGIESDMNNTIHEEN